MVFSNILVASFKAALGRMNFVETKSDQAVTDIKRETIIKNLSPKRRD